MFFVYLCTIQEFGKGISKHIHTWRGLLFSIGNKTSHKNISMKKNKNVKTIADLYNDNAWPVQKWSELGGGHLQLGFLFRKEIRYALKQIGR